ncbi:MAG TPA: T9SS type A sorting domain-containing protein, partial [Candidatus Krumholzibacterium sp.]|nr:T9SS type A sorting domain-containing protein [Candidatus Krumholzibacterium sp.]
SDPNPPVSYRLEEYSGLSPVTDQCEAGDTLWYENGFSLSTARSFSGLSSYYSGAGDDLDNYIEMASFYPASFGDTISCRMFYDIEADWDYAYVETSMDGGLRWQTLPGNITTDSDPNGNNRGNGITGSSGGWTDARFYLGDVPGAGTGSVMRIRFTYSTDASVQGEGIYIDDVSPVASYGSMTVLAEALTDTFYIRSAGMTGEFAYQVRASDADGHVSRGSNVVFHEVTEITGDDPIPLLASSLPPNFPNPFNPSTTIRYTVGATGGLSTRDRLVRIEIFDINGRRVALLADRPMAPGRYSERWNGLDRGGDPVASGIYFLRLDVDGEEFTRKLVLLR